MKKVIFEPWGLGDAVIAAAAAREKPAEFLLACDPKWHSLIHDASSIALSLEPVQLQYTGRDGSKSLRRLLDRIVPKSNSGIREILSIRGDFRDWLVILSTYPKTKIRMTGWMSFLARHVRILNWLYQVGVFKVENRYSRWEKLAKLPNGSISKTYEKLRKQKPPPLQGGKVAIHIGAQWRSRQYPLVSDLKKELQAKGYSVQVIAGPNDLLPSGINEKEVMRPTESGLISELKTADWVITNDSGPMHLAAFIGLRTIVVALISNIAEWIPPGAISVNSTKMPTGYKPLSEYSSDTICTGWPQPKEVVAKLVHFG